MYSALNLRPYLAPSPSNPSYWFLAIGYFNVVLPTFLPADVAQAFWHRARTAKVQSAAAAKSRMLVPRTRCMALERGARLFTAAAARAGLPDWPISAITALSEDEDEEDDL